MSKDSWKDISAGFQLTVFENKRAFMKKAVLQTTILIYCKARQVLRNLLSNNQENGSEMTFAEGTTKINLKKFENLTVTGWFNAGSSLKASVI